MNCTEFRERWSAWREGWPDCDPAAMRAHCHACAACARYDAQMRRMLDTLAELPSGASEPAPVIATGGSLPRWSALAATLALGVLLGVLASLPFGGSDPRSVALDASGVQRVALAFESPARLRDVEFVVELPPGVEMLGYPDQREVRWRGELAAGRSRLQLPLRITGKAEPGTLVTRVVHASGERRLEVLLEPAGGESGNGSA